MTFQTVKFAGRNNEEFYRELRKRVNAYFKENQISRYGNAAMVVKTVFMLCLYLVPYTLLLTLNTPLWTQFIFWVLMGFGMAGLGLAVMHDANHGAYSKKEWVNRFVGKVLFLLGGSDVNWRIQHNVLHHTYTNVTGMDEDIDPGATMRFSPHEKRRWIHRYQHLYAWFLYGLMTLFWFTVKDYLQAARYKKMGLIGTQNVKYSTHMTAIILSKIAYAGLFIALPIIFANAPWWFTVLGFVTMQFICGLMLSMIFQPAHVVPTSDYPMPDASGNIDADWAVNQLYNTANFAPKARILSWYVGGLNYQVEHHLFPNICHVHYNKISPIVEQTAKEYGLPYHSYKTFIGALTNHTRMLKDLGRNDLAPAIH